MSKKKFGPLVLLNNLRYLSKYSLKEMNKQLDSMDMFVNKAVIKSKFIELPQIKNNFETLENLINTQNSFIRFGDGEYAIMDGNDIPFQKHHPQLAETLREVIYNEFPGLITGLPYEHLFPEKEKYNPIVKDYANEYLSRNLDLFCKFVNPNKLYYSSSLSQLYPVYKEYDFEKHFSMFRQIWDKKKVLLVCGDRVISNLKHNILDNALDIKTIFGPTIDAYCEYNNLLNNILEKSEKDRLIIFALGPAGKALAYELYKKGYRVLDIGHTFKDYDTYKSNTKMDKEGVIKFFSND